jgi:hypothetical protein
MIRHGGRGQALVEFALVLPLFLLLVLGVVDFGRGIFIYAGMSNGAREGARYAIVHGSLAQSIDGSCGSGPGTASTTSDSLGGLVIEATGAAAAAWAPPPGGCPAPITVSPVGLDPTRYRASVCWGDACTVPADCSGPGTNTSPSNVPDVPVTVRTCYRFTAIVPSMFGLGPIALAADSTLSITH